MIKTNLLLFTLIVGGLIMSESVQAEGSEPVDNKLKPFDYKYLSNEDIDPFLWYGKVPVFERGKGRLNRYVRTARKIRDVRDCLIRSEQKKAAPDLRLIDWRNLGEGVALDVCLFRIFASIGDIEGVANWMRYHKIEPTISKDLEDNSWMFKRGDARKTLLLRRLDGRYDTKANGPLVPRNSIIAWVFGGFMSTYVESITSQWTKDGKLMRVNYSASRK